jgi:hypothetical protein
MSDDSLLRSFFRKARLHIVHVEPERVAAVEQLARDIRALAARAHAGGFQTAAYLLDNAAFAATAGYLPADESAER